MNNQLIQSIISYYVSEFKNKYGNNPVVNRNTVKYLIDNMLRDLSVEEIKDLIVYYLQIETEPSLQKLCYEYDDILIKQREEQEDAGKRRIVMNETHRRVLEFRQRYGINEK